MPAIPQPLFPDDDGTANPHVLAAFSEDDAHFVEALRSTRVFVPVVAQLLATNDDGSEKESEMALALLQHGERRVLPAFTSIDSLQSWRSDARPVGVAVEAAALQALHDDMLGVLIDGSRLISGPALNAIIFDFPLTAVHEDPLVEQSLESAIALHEEVVTAWLSPAEEVDAVINLLIPTRHHENAPKIARAVAQWLADDPNVRLRTSKGFDVQVVTAR